MRENAYESMFLNSELHVRSLLSAVKALQEKRTQRDDVSPWSPENVSVLVVRGTLSFSESCSKIMNRMRMNNVFDEPTSVYCVALMSTEVSTLTSEQQPVPVQHYHQMHG